jgi:hypothetical protein
MAPDDLRKLANDILDADSEAEMYRLLAPLSAEGTEDVALLVKMAAMRAWVERERVKGARSLRLANCGSELGLLGRL